MKDILRRCKCGVYFTANEHKDNYEKAEDWLISQCQGQEGVDAIGKDIWNKMVETGTVYSLQFYPHTPIGSYRIFHYDYDKLLNMAHKILEENNV